MPQEETLTAAEMKGLNRFDGRGRLREGGGLQAGRGGVGGL